MALGYQGSGVTHHLLASIFKTPVRVAKIVPLHVVISRTVRSPSPSISTFRRHIIWAIILEQDIKGRATDLD